MWRLIPGVVGWAYVGTFSSGWGRALQPADGFGRLSSAAFQHHGLGPSERHRRTGLRRRPLALVALAGPRRRVHGLQPGGIRRRRRDRPHQWRCEHHQSRRRRGGDPGSGLTSPVAGQPLDLNIAAAGTLGVDGVSAYVSALSGSGTIDLGTGTLTTTVGAGDTSSFSGTINSANYSYTSPYGSFVKLGAGTLVIDDSDMNKGEGAVNQGAFAVTSGTANWDTMMVGSGAGADGSLNVSGGALNIGVALRVGDFGGTGTVNQTGGTVMVKADCPNIANCAALNIGNQGGTGIYNISGDGQLILQGGSHSIGRNAGANAASNGTLNISGDALVELRPMPERRHRSRLHRHRRPRQEQRRRRRTAAAPSTRPAAPSAIMAGSEL